MPKPAGSQPGCLFFACLSGHHLHIKKCLLVWQNTLNPRICCIYLSIQTTVYFVCSCGWESHRLSSCCQESHRLSLQRRVQGAVAPHSLCGTPCVHWLANARRCAQLACIGGAPSLQLGARAEVLQLCIGLTSLERSWGTAGAAPGLLVPWFWPGHDPHRS